MTVLVTGGAGFIGSALVRALVRDGETVVNLDRLTYAGHLASLREIEGAAGHLFVEGDINDSDLVREMFTRHRPAAVYHLAAESHVDRSIESPAAFVETNVTGTMRLLDEALLYWRGLSDDEAAAFRFLMVSTDEVFGALGPEGMFDETTPYHPNSPYSASKAAADHFARAWRETYGLPVLISNCSNNYGPYQFPEKLLPLTILNALEGKPLPVYGKGENVRDWLHVDDHVSALRRIVEAGEPGATYLVGSRNPRRNIDVVREVCAVLDRVRPDGAPHDKLITFVTDRPGHDFRYAIDPTRIETDLGWRHAVAFESGLAATVEWYMANRDWCDEVSGRYDRGRLGVDRKRG